MGEYAPDEGEIRLAYIIASSAPGIPEQLTEAYEEFNRCMAIIRSEAAEKALRDAADRWTQGAWANDLPPRGPDAAYALILGTSQRAGDFMRAEADRIASEGTTL